LREIGKYMRTGKTNWNILTIYTKKHILQSSFKLEHVQVLGTVFPLFEVSSTVFLMVLFTASPSSPIPVNGVI
jgi:hypothetical protein